MFARSSLPVLIGFICLLGIFLMGRDSRHAAADPQPPHAPADHPAGAENPRARIFPILSLLLLSDDTQCVTDADCDDGNPCTDSTCDPAVGCVHVNNTAPCDDGNPCTTVDICSDGTCVGGPPWLECDNGNPCTLDWCDSVTGCNHVCLATGPSDPCCSHPACSSDPRCQFSGGFYVATVTDLNQDPHACFLGDDLRDILLGLIGGSQAAIFLPHESFYPTTLTLNIPFLGNLDVYARFEDGEIHFDEVVLDPIHLKDFADFLPPDLRWLICLMWCVIRGNAEGWTQGLDAGGFGMTIRLKDLNVTRDQWDPAVCPGLPPLCMLTGVYDNCHMDFTVTATRLGP